MRSAWAVRAARKLSQAIAFLLEHAFGPTIEPGQGGIQLSLHLDNGQGQVVARSWRL